MAERTADAPLAIPACAIVVDERARWEDVDLVGIVRYGAYTRLVDAAEAELLRAAGLAYPRVQERFALWLVRRALHVEYRAPARFDAPLRVAAWLARVGRTSVVLRAAVSSADGAVRHADAEVVLVAVDAGDLAKRELPSALVAALAPWTARDGA